MAGKPCRYCGCPFRDDHTMECPVGMVTFERVLRICADAHRKAGQLAVANMYEEAADKEGQRP